MKIVRQSKSGIDYITGSLKDKQRVVTKVLFYKVSRENHDDELNLKIGRYNKSSTFNPETLECGEPKSELTLDSEEFSGLLDFIEENYGPLLSGAGKYIKADADLDEDLAKKLVVIFKNKDKRKVADFLINNDLLPEDTSSIIEYSRREVAIKEFELKLDNNEVEYEWQKWFEKNDWVLGNEFEEILDDRRIDPENIADYLMETFDGFVDLVEIKRPDGGLTFWATELDHGNLVPHNDLIKAITQTQNYIHQLELEMNNIKTQKRLSGASIVKPRATLLFGRSDNWDNDRKEAFRLLNSSYNNLTIMTYDHVLARAKRSLSHSEEKEC